MCPSCSHESPDGVRFCDRCGTPLTRACPSCGTELRATVRFCVSCGTPVGQSTPPAPDVAATIVTGRRPPPLTEPVRTPPTPTASPPSPAPAPLAPVMQSAVPVPPALRVRPDDVAFIGRERELAILRHALQEAGAGRGSAILIGGPRGAGKSRLLAEIGAEARRSGVRVIAGHGRPMSAYAPWTEAISALIADRDGAALLAELGPAAGDLAVVAPSAGQRPAVVPGGERSAGQVATAVAALLHTASQVSPLFIVLDDLHQVDTSSMELLKFVAGGLREARILIALAYDDDQVRSELPFARAAGELVRTNIARQIHPRGLTDDDASRLMTAVAGMPLPRELVTALEEIGGGSPRFLTDAVRVLATEHRLEDGGAWHGAVPLGPRDAVGRLLAALPPTSLNALKVAAVLGGVFDADLLERVAGLPSGGAAGALAPAAVAGIVVESPEVPGRYTFTHELPREVLVDALPAIERAHLHRRAGDALASLMEAGSDARLDELVHHFSEAAAVGTAGQAVEYARRAAERAARSLAYPEAAAFTGRALVMMEYVQPPDDAARHELLVMQARFLHACGDLDGAQQSSRRAAEIARDLGTPDTLARATIAYRDAWGDAALGDPFFQELAQLAVQSLTGGDPALHSRVLAAAGRPEGTTDNQSRRGAQTVVWQRTPR